MPAGFSCEGPQENASELPAFSQRSFPTFRPGTLAPLTTTASVYISWPDTMQTNLTGTIPSLADFRLPLSRETTTSSDALDNFFFARGTIDKRGLLLFRLGSKIGAPISCFVYRLFTDIFWKWIEQFVEYIYYFFVNWEFKISSSYGSRQTCARSFLFDSLKR